jgi:hypothetical protein
MSVNWVPDELFNEYFFRVSTYEVCAWGTEIEPRPSEIWIRMDVPGASAAVVLRLRTVAEADDLLMRVASLRVLVWGE